ncbi:hypothetical protein CEXT_67331 [Caerostris extrusa]|uniref:Uncharacterized protein n=1 Tax=Caerostris extrusa TaxID=172846 RepID=A0AAV4WCZ9_CAEEX|nr:hypothetical protein CEXT_67331 [Caerostris extrusa]
MSRLCPEERCKRKHIEKTMGGSPLFPEVFSDDTSLIPGMTLIERGRFYFEEISIEEGEIQFFDVRRANVSSVGLKRFSALS